MNATRLRGLQIAAIGMAALSVGLGCSNRDAVGAGGIGVTGAGGTGAGGAGTGGASGSSGGPAVSPEIDGQLVINELMAANALTTRDEGGAAQPWIEILNPTDSDVPLAGYAVTDDLGVPGKGVIAEGAVAPAHGYLVLWLDGGAVAGPTHVAASLNKAGGAVGLARPDGSFIDRLTYGAQETDLSAAREPDGAATWAIEWHVSPGAANPAGNGAPTPAGDDPETVPTAGDPSDRILGYDQIPQLSITIGADALQALLAAPDTYVPATLTYDGRDYGPVGVKTKGMQSWEPIDRKPSLHVNIDKIVPGAAFFGLKDLTLNNMHSDYSMMHERIAYWVARQAGVPASRANHALVTVNGQLYGLYANVETVKKHILSRAFGNNTGALFSATDVDFTAPYVASYVLVAGPDDRTLLAGVSDALTAPNPDDAIAGAAAFADVDQFTRFWAMCAVVGQLDSFPYSLPGDDYFAYANPAAGRLAFMPWGIDESFYAGDLDVSVVNSVLAIQCKASPSCFQKFVDNVWDILALTDRLNWLGEHDRVAAQIAAYTRQDTRKWYTDGDVAMYQQDMRYFMSERRDRIATWLPPASGAPPTGIMPQP
jgi:hypothetical protein